MFTLRKPENNSFHQKMNGIKFRMNFSKDKMGVSKNVPTQKNAISKKCNIVFGCPKKMSDNLGISLFCSCKRKMDIYKYF